jgi:hypothetical protein
MWMSHSCSWYNMAGTSTPYRRAGPDRSGRRRAAGITVLAGLTASEAGKALAAAGG